MSSECLCSPLCRRRPKSLSTEMHIPHLCEVIAPLTPISRGENGGTGRWLCWALNWQPVPESVPLATALPCFSDPWPPPQAYTQLSISRGYNLGCHLLPKQGRERVSMPSEQIQVAVRSERLTDLGLR